MAGRARPLSPGPRAPGAGRAAPAAWLVPLILLALLLGPVLAVAGRAGGLSALQGADWQALRFTLLQALLSALLSTALAIPVARALARRRFPMRRALLLVLGAPFILPVIVAILGLLRVFGANGWISHFLALFGWPPIRIYGLHGVVLAHVFFNLPLAVRLLMQGWAAIPSERLRLAVALGFSARDIHRLIERPMLRQALPGIFMLIFVICLSSFAVVLALGGGPRATTLELAIYQAFRFDFDLARAASLALLQMALGAAAALLILRLHPADPERAGLGRAPAFRLPGSALMDALWIALAALFLLLPLLAVLVRGLPGLADLPAGLGAAALRSVAVALAATALATALALPLALALPALRRRGGWPGALAEAPGYLSLSVSPLVLGIGLFILLHGLAAPAALALPLTAAANALMSLPFALRALVPAVLRTEARLGPLADSLGMHGWARFRWLHLPRLRGALGYGAALAAALSMGDLGVIMLFSDGRSQTLPLLLYRLMAAYRMEQAAAVALVLLALSLGAFWLFDRGGRGHAEA